MPRLYLLTFLFILSNLLANKPNVVIFYTDDQGTLDTNSFGSKDLYTPYMDKLAKTGISFTQAYAHAVCCPSRAMLLTGRYPQRSNVNSWTQGDMNVKRGTNMALSEYTMAEMLKDNGYRTALFGKWHLGADKNFGPTKQGFDIFHVFKSFIKLPISLFWVMWQVKGTIKEKGMFFIFLDKINGSFSHFIWKIFSFMI